ncbi:MAG: GDSL-type esterase/lipase family protein [Candidatus Delongbacteria bacterium]|jgi:lysophospholipase L1-like esterase|nr:GDSL-type esterase/lipase family protein [Candidatus Delongbacteria bacterium]
MKKILIILNIILLLVVIFLIIKGNLWDRSSQYISRKLDLQDKYHYTENPKYKPGTENFMLFNKQADIVMLGNSITAGIDWNELLGRKDIVNRGINGDITEGMLNRMKTVIKVKPKVCFFLGGINDLTRRVPPENTIANIKNIINTLLNNDVKPVLQSIIYTEQRFYDFEHNNEYITTINDELKKFADDKNILFLDLNEHLSENNLLKAEYSHDGLHLNAKGYSAWGKIVKETIDSLQLTMDN